MVKYIYNLAYLDKFTTHTKFQISVFKKALIFLVLNVFFIPSATGKDFINWDTLYQVVVQTNDFSELLGRKYLSDFGYEKIILIISYVMFIGLIELNRFIDIVLNRFLPFFVYYKRYFFFDAEKQWRKNEKEVFEYFLYLPLSLN